MSEITLPYPPTNNNRLAVVRGRSISSAAYRRWREAAGMELMTQRPRKVPGPVVVMVALCPPDKRIRDLDNVGFKGVLDLLVEHGVIEGDDSRYVREITARWVDSGPACLVAVEPAGEAREAAFQRMVAAGGFDGLTGKSSRGVSGPVVSDGGDNG